MAESLQLNMRCAAGLRHKVASHLDRLMQRILVSAMSMLSRRHRASSRGSDDEADAETQGEHPTCAYLCHGGGLRHVDVCSVHAQKLNMAGSSDLGDKVETLKVEQLPAPCASQSSGQASLWSIAPHNSAA